MTMKCRSNIDDASRPCRIGALPAVMLGIALGSTGSGAWGQCEIAKLVPDDLPFNSQIGTILDMSGDIAVIGSVYDSENGSHAGAAYVYRFDGSNWTLQQKLLAPDGESEDHFGVSVAAAEGMVAVGASRDDDYGENAGAVYVFEFDGRSWVLHSKIHADDADRDDYFAGVAISGDAMIVGASGDDENGDLSGSAYIFRFDGLQWLQEQKLVPEIGHPFDWFGSRVDISGDVAVVGAWGDDTHGQESGSANVFRFNHKTSEWVEEQRFEPNGSGTYQQFAQTVAVWGDTVLIGARGDQDAGFFAGATYAFHYDGSEWDLAQKILPPSDGLHLNFGQSVTMSANTAVIGVDWLPAPSGAAEVFGRIGSIWEPQQMLVPSDAGGGDQFGFAVAMSGDTVLVGARFDDDGAPNGGAAYVFDIDRPILDCNDNLVDDVCETAAGISFDCNANSVPDECDIASGDSSDVNGNGIPDECDADLDGDGSVDVKDLLILLGSWGPCDDCNDCIADLDDDCTVGVGDLLILLGNWG